MKRDIEEECGEERCFFMFLLPHEFFSFFVFCSFFLIERMLKYLGIYRSSRVELKALRVTLEFNSKNLKFSTEYRALNFIV